MKGKIILGIFLLIIAVFAIGCSQDIRCEAPSKVIGNKCCVDANDNGVCDTSEAPAEKPVVKEPEPVVEPVVKEPVEMSEPEPDASYQDYIDSMDAPQRKMYTTVNNLLDKAKSSNENYFYRYSSPNDLQLEFWVLGDKIKTQILEPTVMDKYKTYNMVYLDRVKKTAVGYCETGGKAKCWEGHGPFTETYLKNMRKTPKDWLLELGDEFRFVEQNKINDVLYYIVEYDRPEGGVYRVWIESWKGWPQRIEAHSKGYHEGKFDSRWLYDDLDVGGVLEDDVTPQ